MQCKYWTTLILPGKSLDKESKDKKSKNYVYSLDIIHTYFQFPPVWKFVGKSFGFYIAPLQPHTINQ